MKKNVIKITAIITILSALSSHAPTQCGIVANYTSWLYRGVKTTLMSVPTHRLLAGLCRGVKTTLIGAPTHHLLAGSLFLGVLSFGVYKFWPFNNTKEYPKNENYLKFALNIYNQFNITLPEIHKKDE